MSTVVFYQVKGDKIDSHMDRITEIPSALGQILEPNGCPVSSYCGQAHHTKSSDMRVCDIPVKKKPRKKVKMDDANQ